ncbi:MAG: hypothetical protein WD512_06795, partial [Candidatus Paceibacterota bacterium]
MNFVYLLGSGSLWFDNECRYSIRSVLKYHPNATIHIIGEKPKWYTGKHTYIKDSHSCPYVNKWIKLEEACKYYDTFIAMDDDFFLNEPFKEIHYKSGTIKQYLKNYERTSRWRSLKESTAKYFLNKPRFMLHVPFPIVSKNFLKIAEKYPERLQHPSLSARQAYGSNET